jgi:serine protease Do
LTEEGGRDGAGRLAEQPGNEFFEWGVEGGFEGEDGEIGRGSGPIPDDMEDDVAIGGVGVVVMSGPAGGFHVDLDVTRDRRLIVELEDRLFEVRSGGPVPEPGMEHMERASVVGLEGVAPETLMSPQVLEPAFGRGVVLMEGGGAAELIEPAGIEVGRCQGHGSGPSISAWGRVKLGLMNGMEGMSDRWGFPWGTWVRWWAGIGLMLSVLGQGTGEETALASVGDPADVRRDATVTAVEKVMPAVVNIATRTRMRRGGDPVQEWIQEFYGYGRRRVKEEYSRGSGVVVDEEGYVLTNVHVVSDVDDIYVQFADTQEALPAERVALSEAKDIALLRIRAPEGRRFRAVRFAKEDDLLLGETVIALGNPFGLGGSVSRGILSSKSRRAAESVPEGSPLQIADWLQTDAAINPGNSGGPLVNLRGELIGLNVAILPPRTGAQGIGFAVPIRRINEALAETLSGDSIEGLWFGARLQPGQRPLVIRSVQGGSPADKAGLKAGDVLLEVDGRPAGNLIEFNRSLVGAGSRRDVELLVRRGGRSRNLSLRLVDERRYFDTGLVRRRLGVVVEAAEPGLVVTAVDGDGPGAGRLAPGMVIHGLDGQAVMEVVGLAKGLNRRRTGEVVELSVSAFRRMGPFLRREDGLVRVELR